MSYTEKVVALGARTEAKATEILRLWKAGQISKTEAIGTMSSLIAKANVKATALADASLAATLSLETGEAVPAIGVTQCSGGTILRRAIRKILNTPTTEADMLMRVQRIARLEPIGQAARAHSKALAAQPAVEGWVRGMDADPCQLCRWWYRDGRVWPKNHPMPHHKGCTCTQIPTMIPGVPSTGYTAKIERRRNALSNTKKHNPERTAR